MKTKLKMSYLEYGYRALTAIFEHFHLQMWKIGEKEYYELIINQTLVFKLIFNALWEN